MTGLTLFVTGRLAEHRLKTVLEEINPEFEYKIWNAGVKVAALITESILINRLPRPLNATRVILPGRCQANLNHLSLEFGVRFEKGPNEVNDLRDFYGKSARVVDLSRHNLRLFAEIVDASVLSLEALLIRAHTLAREGADVIDLGCLPDTPFPLLESAVKMLHRAGFKVSVDSADPNEISRAALAGADYLLSLTETNLNLARTSRPVLVPSEHGDLDSLVRAYAMAKDMEIEPILDPILDPIHFGFTDSIARYRELRLRLPEAELMMGTGNLTELTEADSAGVTALLVGVCSELRITNALTVNVSPYTRRTLQEHDAARRLMYATNEMLSVPKGVNSNLLQIHDRNPFANEIQDIATAAAQVRDRNFRVEVAADGIHVFNRDGHWISGNAFDLFDALDLQNDSSHAFYLGAELQKAEIAFSLGKRYIQDEPLNWGVAADSRRGDPNGVSEEGSRTQARDVKCL